MSIINVGVHAMYRKIICVSLLSFFCPDNSAANSELIDIDLAPVVYSNYDPDIHIDPSLEDIYDRLFEFNERGLISTTPLETLQGIPDKVDIMYFGLFALCAPKFDMIWARHFESGKIPKGPTTQNIVHS